MKIEPVTLFSHSRSFETGAVQAPIDSHAQGVAPAFTIFAQDIDLVPETESGDDSIDAPPSAEEADTGTVELPEMEPTDSAPKAVGLVAFISQKEPRLGWSGAIVQLRIERELQDDTQTHLIPMVVADQRGMADLEFDHASQGAFQTGANSTPIASGLFLAGGANAATVFGQTERVIAETRTGDPTHHYIHRIEVRSGVTPGDQFIPGQRSGTDGSSAGLVRMAPKFPTEGSGEDHEGTQINNRSGFAAQEDGIEAISSPDRQALTERAKQITGSSPALPPSMIAQVPSSYADTQPLPLSSAASPTEISSVIDTGELRKGQQVQSLQGSVLTDPFLTHSAVQAQDARVEPRSDSQTNPSSARGPEMSQPALRQVFEAILRSPDGRIDLRLSPEELGGLRLTLVPEGSSIRVMIESDRIETQDLLRRHSHELERALRDAGFENPSFEFSQDRRAPQIFQTLRHDQEVLQASIPPDTARHITGIGRLDLRL